MEKRCQVWCAKEVCRGEQAKPRESKAHARQTSCPFHAAYMRGVTSASPSPAGTSVHPCARPHAHANTSCVCQTRHAHAVHTRLANMSCTCVWMRQHSSNKSRQKWAPGIQSIRACLLHGCIPGASACSSSLRGFCFCSFCPFCAMLSPKYLTLSSLLGCHVATHTHTLTNPLRCHVGTRTLSHAPSLTQGYRWTSVGG